MRVGAGRLWDAEVYEPVATATAMRIASKKLCKAEEQLTASALPGL